VIRNASNTPAERHFTTASKNKKIAAPESPPKPRRSNYRDGNFAGVAILNWLATPHSVSLFA
jgi:hypothetical protein